MKYLAFDVESGGTEVRHSLLSAYFVVIDEDLKTVYGELELTIKPDNKDYVLTAEALSVNGINIIAHDAVAITESKASTLLYEFLKQHAPNGTTKLTPLGHNVAFDVEFIKEHLSKNFNQFVSYRCLDTSSVAQFLKLIGQIPRDLGGSLKDLAAHFEVKPIAEFHTAKTDTWVVIDILRQMRALAV